MQATCKAACGDLGSVRDRHTRKIHIIQDRSNRWLPLILVSTTELVGTMNLISVKPGEEVLDALKREARLRDITDAAIVSLVGAVDSCAITNMPLSDAKSAIETEYKQPMQLT